MGAAQEHLANAVHRGEHVYGAHRRGHSVLGGEKVQVEDGSVTFHQGGLVAQERNALKFQQGVVQRMGQEVTRPLGHHDGDHDQQQLVDVIGDLHHDHG